MPRPTRSSSRARASKAEDAAQEELRRTRPRRRRKADTRAGTPDPEPTKETARRPRRTTRRKSAASSEVDTRIVHLAISPRAAVLLLAAMGRMRYENEPALDAIKEGLKRDLEELGIA